MIPLYTEDEFNQAKSNDKLKCECYNCHSEFFIMKKLIKTNIKQNNTRIRFCSHKCSREYITTKKKVICANCGKIFEKLPNQIKKSKNNFCSRSCNVTYNNTHKTKGIRRSKLEKYIETELNKLFTELEIHFNRKDSINSELDIYIPSLKLAFELNGIFHYEPIYGEDKLNQIQNNDNRKYQACLEHGIELCLIDISGQINFNKKTSQKYLNIIIKIINNKLLNI